MSVRVCDHVFCVDLNRTSVDLMQVKNRRFMYHSNGLLIMGAEDTAKGNKLIGSHAEEYHDASKLYVLPPYDDFIRGWIGVGGKYKDGIIHFAPAIPANNIKMLDKAFDFIEAALANGFSRKAVLRGFPGAWEQKINAVLPETDKSLNAVLAEATAKAEVIHGTAVTTHKEYDLGG